MLSVSWPAKEMTNPKDLGVKIGSKEEVFWTALKKKMEEEIANADHGIEINSVVLEFADKKIAEEKGKA